VLIAGCLAASLATIRLRRLRSAEIGLGAGLLALVAQNLVDFSLELPGLATTAAIAFGCLLARAEEPAKLPLPSLKRCLPWSAGFAVAATLAAIPWFTLRNRENLRAALEEMLRANPAAVRQALPAAFRGYPHEPAFVMLGAAGAVYSGTPDAGRWLNLAMSVAPHWAGPHVLAAQALEQRGATLQAAIEYGLAIAREISPALYLACELVKRDPRAEVALTVAADLPADLKQRCLEHLLTCLPARSHLDESEALVRETLASFPRSENAQIAFVRIAEQRRDPALAVARAEAMVQVLSDSPRAVAALGSTLLGAGQPERALALVDRLNPRLRNEARILDLEAQLCSKLGLTDRFSRVTERRLALYGKSASSRAQIHRGACRLLLQSGSALAALGHAQEAYDLTGDPNDLELLHDVALRTGELSIALRTASELCQLHHKDGAYCRQGRRSAQVP
jgi:tetratricopeptide (TPR) repeat protein